MTNDIVIRDIPEQEASKLETTNSSVVATAQSLEVTNDIQYEGAAGFLKDIKANIKTVEATFADMKDAAHKAHRAVCDKENMFKKPLQEAESLIKSKMQVYYMEQERKRREEEARIREEQKRLAEEELKRAEELHAAGNLEQADAALRTAATIETLGAVVQQPAAQVSGISTVDDYTVTVLNELDIPAYINGMEIRKVDLAAIKRLAKASKGTIKIPGVAIAVTKSIRARI